MVQERILAGRLTVDTKAVGGRTKGEGMKRTGFRLRGVGAAGKTRHTEGLFQPSSS